MPGLPVKAEFQINNDKKKVGMSHGLAASISCKNIAVPEVKKQREAGEL